MVKANDPADFRRDFAIASRDPQWTRVEAPDGAQYPWDDRSTILRRPPFAALSEGSLLGKFTAHPLLVLGDDITTDHISPASAIPPASGVADFLVDRGGDRADLNVFASRRGNWEVMVRGAFHNKSRPKPPAARGAGGAHRARAVDRDPAHLGRRPAIPGGRGLRRDGGR